MKKVSITFCVGKYDSASAKKDCTAETLIKTEAECEKAARHLGYGFQWGFSYLQMKIKIHTHQNVGGMLLELLDSTKHLEIRVQPVWLQQQGEEYVQRKV